MSIVLTCPACGARGKAKDEKAGRQVRCTQCGGVVLVPGPGGASRAAPKPRSAKERKQQSRKEAVAVWHDPTGGPTDEDWHAGRVRASAGASRVRQILFAVLAVAGIVTAIAIAETYMGRVEAARELEQAAGRGDKDAQYELALQYDTGTGRKPDSAEAVRLYTSAAKRGHAEARYVLAEMYANGRGVPRDDDAAVRWYRLATESGHALALDRYRQFAELRGPEEQWRLAEIYRQGTGVDADLAEAVAWYRRAAEGGMLEAQRMLGDLYAEGRGVPFDLAAAFQWYRLAAEQGDAKSAYAIALMYLNAQGTAPDTAESARWIRRAAEGGLAAAQYHLAELSYSGTYVPEDFPMAAQWYRAAALQGHADAQYRFAGMLYNGRGVQQNFSEAAKFFQKAAEQKHARAQYAIGLMRLNFQAGGSWRPSEPEYETEDSGQSWLERSFTTGDWDPVPPYIATEAHMGKPAPADTFIFTPEQGLILRDKTLRREFPPPG